VIRCADQNRRKEKKMNALQACRKRWPTDGAGWPVLKSTNDALMYGCMIAGDGDGQMIAQCRHIRTFFLGLAEHHRRLGRLQKAIDAACQAQLFREAVEEAEKIKEL
jgi:hypothetical protein